MLDIDCTCAHTLYEVAYLKYNSLFKELLAGYVIAVPCKERHEIVSKVKLQLFHSSISEFVGQDYLKSMESLILLLSPEPCI